MMKIFDLILLIVLALFLVWFETTPAQSACIMSYCKTGTASVTSRSYITNIHRQIVGDLYSPGLGQRIQIRDTARRIIGHIEADGLITNIHRQKIGEIND